MIIHNRFFVTVLLRQNEGGVAFYEMKQPLEPLDCEERILGFLKKSSSYVKTTI